MKIISQPWHPYLCGKVVFQTTPTFIAILAPLRSLREIFLGRIFVELLKTLDETTRKRMVAAYVMGYKVTPDDVAAYPFIKAATDSIDTGSVICYNSVSDVKYTKPVVAAPNVMCINPVNWKTDATPAVLDDTITVTLNPRQKVLVVEGYDGSALPNILNILNTGDYHGEEPWLYSECLRKNFRQRINSWRGSCRAKEEQRAAEIR